MIRTIKKRPSSPCMLTPLYSLSGSAIVTPEGEEIPITREMVERTLRALEDGDPPAAADGADRFH